MASTDVAKKDETPRKAVSKLRQWGGRQQDELWTGGNAHRRM